MENDMKIKCKNPKCGYVIEPPEYKPEKLNEKQRERVRDADLETLACPKCGGHGFIEIVEA